MKLWVVCAAAVAAACTVGPDFQRPAATAPLVWGPERTDVPSRTVTDEVQPDWWQSFHDRELISLISRLVAQNLDLQQAAERVLQGDAQRRVAASAGLPQLNEASSYMRERESTRGTISLVTPRPGAPLEYDIWRNGVSASWQLDLFGRVRRAVEAADARTLASVEIRRSVALAVLAELAQDYLTLRSVQAQLTIAAATLTLADANLALVRDRLANGVASTLDMAQAAAQRATIAATVAPLRTQQAALINAIGTLLAEQPRALEAELRVQAALPDIPALVPVGLPGSLLRRRPDVLQAEAELHAATADTGVAVAEFYPDISLTGMFNLDGLRLRDAFSLPARAFDVGPSVSIPIFQGGRLRGQLRLRQSQQRAAAIRWRQTVLTALQEVDDALTAFVEAESRQADLREAVHQNETALDAARQRYREGAADFLNVVSSQASLLQARNALVQSQTAIALDLVQLYRALGGGWQVAE